jgi:hypothetical protein
MNQFNFGMKAGKLQNKLGPGSGWTDTAFNIIWNATKIKCPLVLKYKNQTIIAEGKCPDKNCAARVLLKLLDWNDSEATLKIEVSGYDSTFEHMKPKRRVRNALREAYRETLLTEKPYNLYNKLNTDNYRAGNPSNPPHLPNLKVLQKISEENKKSPGDVVKNLFEINVKEKVFKAFNLVEEQVTIMYWHKLQRNFYINHARFEYTILSLDDTGNIINNLHGDSRKCDELNLFQLQLQMHDEKSKRIGQMLSSRKDKQTVHDFLTKWLNDFEYLPNECIMDGAGALHWAACKVFNECEIKDYMIFCYRFMEGEQNVWKFNTLLRLDMFHFVQMLRRFCRKHKIDKSVKALFLRALVLCAVLTNFKDIHHIFVCVVLIASQRKETKETIVAKNILQNFITRNEIGKLNVQVPVNCQENWVTVIVENLKSLNFKEMAFKNSHYFPELVQYLSYIGRLVHMWSNVVASKAGSQKLLASSNIVESSFSVLKRTVLKGKVTTCDEYIESSLNEIVGQFSTLKSN